MRRILAVLLTLVAIFGAGWLSLRRPDIPYDTLESVYASPDSRYLALSDGGKIHYRDQGNQDGQTLILVHGFSASLHTWEPWVAELSSKYRIISLDLPGHGLSRGFALSEVDMQGFGEVISAVADARGVDKFTLVGSSMGGHAAWVYAVDHADRLEGLVLVGAAGWPAPPEEDDDRPLTLRLLANPVARAVLKDLDNSAIIQSGLEASFVDQTKVSEAMVQRYVALNRAPGHRDAILHIMASRKARPLANLAPLDQLDLPVLVMHGTEDALVPFSSGEAFAETIPGAQFEAYANVGHLPHEEIPVRSANHLDQFLDGLGQTDETLRETITRVAAESAPLNPPN